ncbi:MAG: DinB family protein [Candidatus Acidiferrales bacterium]
MAIRDSILPEFDNEMAITRKTLERVPEGKSNWAPHEKSMKMGRLAGHLAELPSLAVRTIELDSLDFQPAGAPPRVPFVMSSRKGLLETFDKNVASARAAIAGASDEHLAKPWSLQIGGKELFKLPRAAVLRTLILNHVIHHRGQLSVYLRLNNVPVPSIYGPSADENPFV